MSHALKINYLILSFISINVYLYMGARRGEQGGAVAPPWKIKKKKN